MKTNDRFAGISSENEATENGKKDFQEIGGKYDMCKAFDDLMADSRKAGLVEGLDRGENRMGILSKKLIISNRIEDLLRASRDRQYRRELMKEFGIV